MKIKKIIFVVIYLLLLQTSAYSQTCLNSLDTYICNSMSYEVEVRVKIDGAKREGIGRKITGRGALIRRDSLISANSRMYYDLNGRVPKRSIIFIIEIDSTKMFNSGIFGAKLALGEDNDVAGMNFTIPHHVQFNKSSIKKGYYELIIHYGDIHKVKREQIAPQLVDDLIEEGLCSVDNAIYCGDKKFGSIADPSFIDFVLEVKADVIESAIKTYFIDIDPDIKHPDIVGG